MKILRIILAGAVKACTDDFAYCSAQKSLCGREEFPAVEAYCKKTCGTCTEEFEMPTTNVQTNKARLIGPSCEDKSWCNAATCLMPEFIDDCPIACGLTRCNDQEHQQVDLVLEDTCEDRNDNCVVQGELCDHETIGKQIKSICPKTCGVCQPADDSDLFVNCDDKLGEDKCQEVSEYCNSAMASDMMMINCAKTCGFCGNKKPNMSPFMPTQKTTTTTTTTTKTTTTTTAAECNDNNKKCPSYMNYCNHKTHATRIRNLCPKTCGVCSSAPEASPAPITGTCADKTPQKCKTLERTCQWPKYKAQLKEQCPQTCGYCSANEDSEKAPANQQAKFGTWGKRSPCKNKRAYHKRSCLIKPCTKQELYKIVRC